MTVRLVQEGRLLEGAADDRLRIQLQPFLEDRRVDATEVHVRVQVALHQVFRFEGGIFAVMATFHLLTKDKDWPGCAVIGPGAIVVHAPTELREQEDDHIVGMIVLPQVCHEGIQTLAHRRPQVAMAWVLAGVGIEAAMTQ